MTTAQMEQQHIYTPPYGLYVYELIACKGGNMHNTQIFTFMMIHTHLWMSSETIVLVKLKE